MSKVSCGCQWFHYQLWVFNWIFYSTYCDNYDFSGVIFWQSESLRQHLLTCYYGRTQVRTNRTLAQNSLNSSVQESDRGAIMLNRAEMTLHDVQVTDIFLAIYCYWWKSLNSQPEISNHHCLRIWYSECFVRSHSLSTWE